MADRRPTPRLLPDPADLQRAFAEPAETVDPLAEALERGRQEGLAQGRRQAEEIAARRMAEQRTRLEESLASLTRLEQRLRTEYADAMRELALEVASRIVRERIADDDPVACRALEEALAALPSPAEVRARVHPDDLTSIRERMESATAGSTLELVADRTIERGGCVLESPLGTLDARIEIARDAARAAVDGATEHT